MPRQSHAASPTDVVIQTKHDPSPPRGSDPPNIGSCWVDLQSVSKSKSFGGRGLGWSSELNSFFFFFAGVKKLFFSVRALYTTTHAAAEALPINKPGRNAFQQLVSLNSFCHVGSASTHMRANRDAAVLFICFRDAATNHRFGTKTQTCYIFQHQKLVNATLLW